MLLFRYKTQAIALMGVEVGKERWQCERSRATQESRVRFPAGTPRPYPPSSPLRWRLGPQRATYPGGLPCVKKTLECQVYHRLPGLLRRQLCYQPNQRTVWINWDAFSAVDVGS